MIRIAVIALMGAIHLMAAEIGSIVEAEGNVTVSRFSEEQNATVWLPVVVKQQGRETPFSVNKNDTIHSGKLSRAKVRFIDGTLITLGKETELNIARYRYNEKLLDGRAQFNFAKGAFRSITGKIGKLSPRKFKLRTQTATIGIRGTDILGLIGGGSDTIACRQGELAVADPNGLGEIPVTAGQLTRVAEGQLPLPARAYSREELESLMAGAGVVGDELKEGLEGAVLLPGGEDQNVTCDTTGGISSAQGCDDTSLEKIFKF